MQTAGRFLNFRYKLIAIVIAISLWSVVNFGSRTAITVSKYVEIRDASEEFIYKVKPERVNVTVYVIERLLTSKFLENVKAYVNVKHIKTEGRYRLKVNTETEIPLLIQPTAVDPNDVYVFVIKKEGDVPLGEK